MSRRTIALLATVLALCSTPACSLICYICADYSGHKSYERPASTAATTVDLNTIPPQCRPTTVTQTTPEATTTDPCASYYDQIYGTASPSIGPGFCGFPFEEGTGTPTAHCGGTCFTRTKFESNGGVTTILRGCSDANVTTTCEKKVDASTPPVITMTCISACTTDFCNSAINYAESHATRLHPAQSTLWMLLIASAGVAAAAAASLI